MSREAQVPLALWISAAIVFHLAGGGTAVEVAQTLEDRAEIRALIQAVRTELRPPDTTFEILLDETLPTPPAQVSLPPEKEAPAAEDEAKEEPDEVEDEPPKPAPVKQPEKPKPRPEESKPEEQKDVEKPPEPVAVPAVPLPDMPPPPPPAPAPEQRIAIQQHARKDQEDNPTASRIADDANRADDETVARVRAHDQDSAEPSPGTHLGGPKDAPGNGERDDVAHSEDKAGDPDHAPGEAAARSEASLRSSPTPARPGPLVAKAEPASGGARPGAPVAPAPPPQAASPGGAGPASPEVLSAERGTFTLNPANPGGDGKSARAGKKRVEILPSPVVNVAKGIPGAAVLTMAGVEAAVGDKQLKAEREADGASRRSEHRGSWQSSSFERWRAAIENYEPSVKLGNQTSLNAARVPFASYIHAVHNRIHPIFADQFLDSLPNLPSDHVLNQDLVTHMEIVLTKDEGRIVRLGVTSSSGSTAFDMAALTSVSRASPYGKAPDAIASPDGNVYLHWEFHRDRNDACSTRFAYPYMLKEAPKLDGPARPPRRAPAPSSDERRALPGPLVPLREP
jgi:hypothetical protein